MSGRPGGRALLAALAVYGLRFPMAWLLQLLFPAQGAATQYVILILQEGLVYLLPAVLLGGGAWHRPRPRPARMVMVLAAGGLAQYAFSALGDVWVRMVGANATAVALPATPAEGVLAVLALVVMPAVAEESFFRGLLQRGLAGQMSPRGAWLLSAAVFALMHGSLSGLAGHVCCGLLLGACLLGTDSLPLCMLLHGAYNAAALWWSLYPAQPVQLLPVVCGAALLGLVAWWVHGKRGHGRLNGQETVLAAALLALEAARYW